MNAAVLVTGGHGVIGSWVCRELAVRGVEAVVLDVAETPAVAFPDVSPPPFVVGDVRDSTVLQAVFAAHPIGRVLHLAAIVGEPCERDPVMALEVNSVATARVLEAAAVAGAGRVIAMSTKGTLGPLDARYLHPVYEPVPVDLTPAPQSIYETSKLVVERLVTRARARLDLEAAAVRLATTWGPGKSGASHGAFSAHSDVVAAAAAGRSTRLDAHPDQGFDLVYYADIAAGLVAAALSDAPLRRPVYHIGSGRIVTAAAFAAGVETTFPGIRIELGERFPATRNCLLDLGPAREDFGYEPAWDLTRALADARNRLGA